ncbi:hypothetical protein [Tenacibaculum sp. MAR_2010_89]|uniref:hypothetical protein n=1 Tax=Tenacibaculum sp. MAR_2010_89 TaxID=1250198 RepID=UPI00159F7996|nr:hypothetical protein [Tenacibaculum sp. MAR_2010_89]
MRKKKNQSPKIISKENEITPLSDQELNEAKNYLDSLSEEERKNLDKLFDI